MKISKKGGITIFLLLALVMAGNTMSGQAGRTAEKDNFVRCYRSFLCSVCKVV